MNANPETSETSEHPLAGTTMTGAEMIVQVLADEGVDIIFGYSGGAILPTYDAVFRYNADNKDDAGESPGWERFEGGAADRRLVVRRGEGTPES